MSDELRISKPSIFYTGNELGILNTFKTVNTVFENQLKKSHLYNNYVCNLKKESKLDKSSKWPI